MLNNVTLYMMVNDELGQWEIVYGTELFLGKIIDSEW